MIVCVCNAVSDRHIRSAVEAGAGSMRDLARELRVGTCCGKCIPEAKAALGACLAGNSELPAAVWASAADFARP
jgi:bacterioferritin-associated ferredoxin